ncbi:hypothetical protein AQJ67_08770 [Streptomyces caeruleatus]|uniref:Uncharacterized protein n=1 Tax=Streptomyces caeruleatus TaxID=661399 RepID=A0A124IAE4_9ACTN|nr:hypothetical protein AQJ67_08770 [Streptomyces caeruleatus]
MARSAVAVDEAAEPLGPGAGHEGPAAVGFAQRGRVPRGGPGVGGVEEPDAELGGAGRLGVDRQTYGTRMVVGDQLRPGTAALDDAVRPSAALALERGAGAGEPGGVLDEEAGDAPVQGEGGGVGADLGAQGVQGGGVAVVDVGAFGGVGEVAEDVAQVEDGEVAQVRLPDQRAEFVRVGVDVLVGYVDQIAEDMAVGADDDVRAGRVDACDVRAQGVQEAEGKAFGRGRTARPTLRAAR